MKHMSWYCDDFVNCDIDAISYVAQRVGLDAIHIQLPWAQIETLPGTFDFSLYRAKLEKLSTGAHLQFIVSLNSSHPPSWLPTCTSDEIFARDFDGNLIPELDIFDDLHIPYLLRFYDETLAFLKAINPNLIYAAFPAITGELEIKFGQFDFRWRSFTDAAQRRFTDFLQEGSGLPMPVPRFNNLLSEAAPQYLEFYSSLMDFREQSLLAYVQRLCKKIRDHNVETIAYFGEFFTYHDAIYAAGIVEFGQSAFDIACVDFNFYNGFALTPDTWVTPVLVNYARNLGYKKIRIGIYLERYSLTGPLDSPILSAVRRMLDQVDDGRDLIGFEIGGIQIGDVFTLPRYGFFPRRGSEWGGHLPRPVKDAVKIAILASFDNHYLWHGDFSCGRDHLHDVLKETYRILRQSEDFNVSILSARKVAEDWQVLDGFDVIFLPHLLAMRDDLVEALTKVKRSGIKLVQDIGAATYTADGAARDPENIRQLFGLTEMEWRFVPGKFHYEGGSAEIRLEPDGQYFCYTRLRPGPNGRIRLIETDLENAGIIVESRNALSFGFLPQLSSSGPGKMFWETLFRRTIVAFVRLRTPNESRLSEINLSAGLMAEELDIVRRLICGEPDRSFAADGAGRVEMDDGPIQHPKQKGNVHDSLGGEHYVPQSIMTEERAAFGDRLEQLAGERDAIAAKATKWAEAAMAITADDDPMIAPSRRKFRRWLDALRRWLPGTKHRRFSPIVLADRAVLRGQWELAARYYRDALRVHPNDPTIWFRCGYVLRAAGKLSEAEVAFQRAFEHCGIRTPLPALRSFETNICDTLERNTATNISKLPPTPAPAVHFPTEFSHELPALETALGIFDDWNSLLPLNDCKSGVVPLFSMESDPRPSYVKKIFGSLEELDVLELGSFEGGHTYQLERLGAKSVIGIEANPSSFLKSLVVKEALALKAQFLHGDFIRYLEQGTHRFGLIFACGVLYHMPDPLHLLHLISQATDRLFIWTMYVSEYEETIWPESAVQSVVKNEYACKYYKYEYDVSGVDRWYSGIERFCCRLRRADIIGALQAYGLSNIKIMDEQSKDTGSRISIVAYR